MGERVTAREMRKRGYLDTLAQLFDDRTSARFLLEDADLDPRKLPGYGNQPSLQYWREVCSTLDNGKFTGNPLARLLRAAHDEYPGNPSLIDAMAWLPSREASSPSPDPEAEARTLSTTAAEPPSTQPPAPAPGLPPGFAQPATPTPLPPAPSPPQAPPAEEPNLEGEGALPQLYLSAAPADRQLRDALRVHFSPLEFSRQLKLWTAEDLPAGAPLGAVNPNLQQAAVILLLISPSYFADPRCQAEMQAAWQRHSRGEARVVPILLTAVEGLDNFEIHTLKPLPPDGRPVDQWESRDQAFSQVVKGVRQVILATPTPSPKPSAHTQTPPKTTPSPTPARPRPTPPSHRRSGDRPSQPDLILDVSRPNLSEPLKYAFQDAHGIRQDWQPSTVQDSRLRELSDSLFSKLNAWQDLSMEQRIDLGYKVRGVGADLGDALLPRDLRDHLLQALRQIQEEDPERIPTLWIRSYETSLPWELLSLESGRLLGEDFAITRWLLNNHHAPSELRLRRMALLSFDKFYDPDDGEPDWVKEQAIWIEKLPERGWGTDEVTTVKPRLEEIADGLRGGAFDAWHLVIHGQYTSDDPLSVGLLLDHGTYLSPLHFRGFGQVDLDGALIFANACYSAQVGSSEDQPNGLPAAFLRVGAGAYIGAHFNLNMRDSLTAAQRVYEELAKGHSLAEIFYRLRNQEHEGDPNNPMWWAYTVFGHPLAVLA